MGSIRFRFGKDLRLAPPPRTAIDPVQPVMVVEERPDDDMVVEERLDDDMVVEERLDDDMVLDQYPGSNLSISELCHALKIKLSQTRDPRYEYTTAQWAIAFQLIHSPLQNFLSPPTS